MLWYDPIDQRWILTREPVADPAPVEVPEDDYARGARLVRQSNVWDAVVASATASCINSSRSQEIDECSESAKQ